MGERIEWRKALETLKSSTKKMHLKICSGYRTVISGKVQRVANKLEVSSEEVELG